MLTYDVFNGDADGICALIQLRLEDPRDSVLVTGVKRDIALVQLVPDDAATRVNVLDISLDKNRDAVDRLLAAGSELFYVDHHFSGNSLPEHPGFQSLIDTRATTCTSLLINQHLDGRHLNWAITAAFGDNLDTVARRLAEQAGLSEQHIRLLKELGVYINYNGYGASLDDLHFHPADLYRVLVRYPDPLDFILSGDPAFQLLRSSYTSDLARGLAAPVMANTEHSLVIKLPDVVWARRVSGVLGNILANANPDKACAVITDRPDGRYLVSIRSPLNNRTGADDVARQFPTGGGRKAAAGITALPAAQLDAFLNTMARFWRT